MTACQENVSARKSVKHIINHIKFKYDVAEAIDDDESLQDIGNFGLFTNNFVSTLC